MFDMNAEGGNQHHFRLPPSTGLRVKKQTQAQEATKKELKSAIPDIRADK